MPRYFFDIHDTSLPARAWADLDGPEAACREAVLALSDMLRDTGETLWATPTWRMQVTDEAGATVCVLTLPGTLEES